MTKKKWLKLSLITFLIALGVFAIAYFFFHFVTDTGITLIWQAEAGKPLVASMIANFGVLFLFASVVSLIVAFVFFDREK